MAGFLRTRKSMAPLLSPKRQTQSLEVAMKPLKVLPIAFMILIFSGCYTQLAVKDDDPWTAPAEPVYLDPPPAWMYYPSEPIVITAPPPTGGSGNYNPTSTGATVDPHRDSGYERRESNSSDNARGSDSNRGNENYSTPTVSTAPQISVPTRATAAPASPTTSGASSPSPRGRR